MSLCTQVTQSGGVRKAVAKFTLQLEKSWEIRVTLKGPEPGVGVSETPLKTHAFS